MPLSAPERHRSLLGDALGPDTASATLFSHEALGDGSVTGFLLGDSTLAYVDTSGIAVAEETGWASAEHKARVWVHPADPHLPALVPAAFGHASEILLQRLGIEGGASPEMVGYRPGRRAVLRTVTGQGDMWVKVVRPRHVERIARIHRVLGEGGIPVPAVRGWSPVGLLILESAQGTPATSPDVDPTQLLDAVDDLRDRLSRVELEGRARTSLRARARWYANLLHDALPEAIPEVDAVVAHAPARGALAEDVTIHGDLHLGQLFLGPGGEITGIIDVDTAGAGAPADDAAAFIGHAVASAELTAETARDDSARETPVQPTERAARIAHEAVERWGDAAGVRELTGIHLLGHAVGAAGAGAGERARRLVAHAHAVSVLKTGLTFNFESP